MSRTTKRKRVAKNRTYKKGGRLSLFSKPQANAVVPQTNNVVVQATQIVPQTTNNVTYKEVANKFYEKILEPLIYKDLGTNVISFQTVFSIGGSIREFSSIINAIIAVYAPGKDVKEEDYLTNVENFLKFVFGNDILSRINVQSKMPVPTLTTQAQPEQSGWFSSLVTTKQEDLGPLSLKEIVDAFDKNWNNLFDSNVQIAEVNFFIRLREYIRSKNPAILEMILFHLLGENVVKRMGLKQ
jgi:hypothetical protein